MIRVSRLAPLLVFMAAVPIFLLILAGGNGAKPPVAACTPATGLTTDWATDPAGVLGGEQIGDTRLDADQMQVATEAVQAVRAFGPTADQPHAAVILLAAGYQESTLRNLDYGDRDSLGFLQQRPSQGWGTPTQVRDVTFAATTFLKHVVQLPQWQTRPVTDVAADVQHLADANRGRYQQWVPLATDLVERLWPTSATGANSPVSTLITGSMRLHQANLYVGETPAQFRDDLALVVADRPDFVTLNEVYNRSGPQLQPSGYQAWHPTSPRDARDTAVLWRTDTWTLADKGVLLMHSRPVTWGTRYVSWVTLTATTGQTVSVISGHASPGGAGRDGLFEDFRARLVQLIGDLSISGPVLFGGDLNVPYPHQQPAQTDDFEQPFAQAGAQTTYAALGEPAGGWATGTHHGATIDYVIAAGAVPVRHATIALHHSDHRMVSAELLLTGPRDGDGDGNGHDCDSITLVDAAGAVVYPVPADLAGSNQNNWGGHGAHWHSWHPGTDFSVPCGTPVLAAHAGVIEIDTSQGWAGPWLVKVTRGPGQLTTWYAHMQTLVVSAGQTILPGQQIGEVGDQGNATGCHLHFEVHLKGGPIYGPDNTDPTAWLAATVGTPPDGPGGRGRPRRLVGRGTGLGAKPRVARRSPKDAGRKATRSSK